MAVKDVGFAERGEWLWPALSQTDIHRSSVMS